MNNHLTQFETSGDTATNSMNLALIRMQIQAFTESLRRLEHQGDLSQIELAEKELKESQTRPNC